MLFWEIFIGGTIVYIIFYVLYFLFGNLEQRKFIKRLSDKFMREFNYTRKDLFNTYLYINYQSDEIQASEEFLVQKKQFESILTEEDKSLFKEYFSYAKTSPYHLLTIYNRLNFGSNGDELELVLGLFPITEEYTPDLKKLLNEYITLKNQRHKKMIERLERNALVTNFGWCPKLSNVSIKWTKKGLN